MFKELAQNPINSDQLCITGKKMFYTTNNALSSEVFWSNVYPNIYSVVGEDVWCDAEYSPSGTLWINACKFSDSKSFLLKSDSNGLTLTPTISNIYIGGTTGATVGIKVLNDDLIYTAGGTMYRITNNGSGTPAPVTSYNSSNTHADIRDICFPIATDYNIGFIVTDGGVNRTLTGGNNQNEWERIYGNLALNEFYTVSISEQDTEVMLAGAHDNGTYKRLLDGTWTNHLAGDGGATLISPLHPDTMFKRGNYGPKRSVNGGVGWSSLSGFSKVQNGYDLPFLAHPASSEVFYHSFPK